MVLGLLCGGAESCENKIQGMIEETNIELCLAGEKDRDVFCIMKFIQNFPPVGI